MKWDFNYFVKSKKYGYTLEVIKNKIVFKSLAIVIIFHQLSFKMCEA